MHEVNAVQLDEAINQVKRYSGNKFHIPGAVRVVVGSATGKFDSSVLVLQHLVLGYFLQFLFFVLNCRLFGFPVIAQERSCQSD